MFRLKEGASDDDVIMLDDDIVGSESKMSSCKSVEVAPPRQGHCKLGNDDDHQTEAERRQSNSREDIRSTLSTVVIASSICSENGSVCESPQFEDMEKNINNSENKDDVTEFTEVKSSFKVKNATSTPEADKAAPDVNRNKQCLDLGDRDEGRKFGFYPITIHSTEIKTERNVDRKQGVFPSKVQVDKSINKVTFEDSGNAKDPELVKSNAVAGKLHLQSAARQEISKLSYVTSETESCKYAETSTLKWTSLNKKPKETDKSPHHENTAVFVKSSQNIFEKRISKSEQPEKTTEIADEPPVLQKGGDAIQSVSQAMKVSVSTSSRVSC